jgi:polar amino acid transport system permease protein|tara:strand:+ start:1431 stop:2162 length:732 start_codon:yes stop_codon:yes gene_type:complete
MVGLVWLTIEGASEMGYNWQWYQIPKYFYRVIDEELIWGPLATGLVVTIEISLYSMLLTLVLGLLTALLRMSNSLSGQVLARVYLETIRNTPMLVQIYVFYFVIAPVLGIDRFWTGVLCLGLFEGSFASEIIRAGINSVPRGQWEAASSVGLSRFSSYRYVVLPQAIPLMLPPMTGVLINLIKHSAIVSVIAVFELTTEGRNIIADTYMAFEVWLTVAGIYLVLTVSLSIFVGYLERRLRQPA